MEWIKTQVTKPQDEKPFYVGLEEGRLHSPIIVLWRGDGWFEMAGPMNYNYKVEEITYWHPLPKLPEDK